MNKVTLRTFLDNLTAFNHLKFNQTKKIIDFSSIVYVKMEGIYLKILITPLLSKQKPNLIVCVQDISQDPSIQQIISSVRNSDFLINDISQKIKQPLNCTVSMLEIIMNTTPIEVKEKYISPALAGCKLLINSANDILDYYQLQKKGSLDLMQIDVQILEFLTDVINVVRAQAIFRGLKIDIAIRQNVPQFFKTDPNRLRQILLNLLVVSIQATVKGSISVVVAKSATITDHIEFYVKVKALETNFSILKIIDKTVRYFKAQSLKQKYQDLATLKQYSQSILISFCLSLSLSAIPLDYTYERMEEREEFQFILKVKNLNPQFISLLNQRRQTALMNISIHKEFTEYRKQDYLHQLSAPNEQKRQSIKINVISPTTKIKELSQESDSSNSDDAASIDSKLAISKRVEGFIKSQHYFFDYVNEKNNQSSGLLNVSPSQQLTFGGQGRSSIYSSLCFTSGTMQPNDLLDCFEKMDKIKQQKNKCQCVKILICESIDLDLYALSHQLDNLGIVYDYITQKSLIVDTLQKLLIETQPCCKGLQLLFIGVDNLDDDLNSLFTEIKDIYQQFKAEPRIIGLIGCMDEDDKAKIRKMPFHDFLSKPVLMDALLFILAKWIKIQ